MFRVPFWICYFLFRRWIRSEEKKWIKVEDPQNWKDELEEKDLDIRVAIRVSTSKDLLTSCKRIEIKRNTVPDTPDKTILRPADTPGKKVLFSEINDSEGVPGRDVEVENNVVVPSSIINRISIRYVKKTATKDIVCIKINEVESN